LGDKCFQAQTSGQSEKVSNKFQAVEKLAVLSAWGEKGGDGGRSLKWAGTGKNYKDRKNFTMAADLN
jgi:hypothetical protein